MAMRKALVVGINYYEHISTLYGCVDDAHAVKNTLERNSDDTVNKDDVLDYVFVHQRITKVNGVMLKQYGARLEEFIGSMPSDFFAHDLAYGRDVWMRFFDAGRLHTETDERKLDGTPIWIEGDYICMYDDQGRITGHFGIQRDITERKRVEQQMVEHDDRLRSLASELSLSEERQRHRIATELHDNTSQELAFTLTKLQNIREAAGRDSRESLSEVCEVMSKVVKNIRNMTFDICSPTLYRFGLEAAVSELLEDKLATHDEISYDFHDDKKVKPLSQDIKVTLFQSVRELINNLIKHAQACNVTVDIHKCEDTIKITVSDDGVGFKVDELESPERSRGGFGLFSIAERLKYIGGNFEFQPRSGRGSSFTLEAPLEADTNFCQGEYDGGQNVT